MKNPVKLAIAAAVLATFLPAQASAFPHTAFLDADKWTTPAEAGKAEAYGRHAGGQYAWAFANIRDASAWELILGYPGGSTTVNILGARRDWDANPQFKPEGTITRAEFGTILARVTGFELEHRAGDQLPFQDTSEDWFTKYLAPLARRNVIRAADYEAAMLRPNEPITRVEMATWIARAVAEYGVSLDRAPLAFTDIPAGFRYADDLSAALSLGIIKGYPDGTFRPQASATRAEATAMLTRLVPLLRQAPPSTDTLRTAVDQALSAYAAATKTVAKTQARIFGEKVDEAAARELLEPYFTDAALKPIAESRTVLQVPNGWSHAGWLLRTHSVINDLYMAPTQITAWMELCRAAELEPILIADRYALVKVSIEMLWANDWTGDGKTDDKPTYLPGYLYLVKKGDQWKVSGYLEER